MARKDRPKDKPKKKGIVKKVFLCILLVILVWFLVDLCITAVYARKIPHRYATAEEGRELLRANTDYYEKLTKNDIEYRVGRSGATVDELLDAQCAEIKDFNLLDKYIMERNVAKLARKLKKNDYELPPLEEIVYIKTDMKYEGIVASGYTHGNEIYLNSLNILSSLIPEAGTIFEQTMWHELFHCLTRNNPDFRAEVYELIGFTIADSDFEIPPSVQEKLYNNPDVDHHNAYATFNIDGEEKDCFLAWIVDKSFSEAQSSEASDSVVLVPIDGTDTYYTKEQALNFDEVVGTNTDYLIDPEEILADNFKYAMAYGLKGRDGQGYPNPEIIQGIIDIMSAKTP